MVSIHVRRTGSRLLPGLILLKAVLGTPLVRADAQPQSPQQLFQELFVDVQDSQIFPDGKTFVDAVPKSAPDMILEAFRSQPPGSRAALEQFVSDNFTLPLAADASPSSPERVPLAEHIDRLWDVLTRGSTTVPLYSSLLPLPERYVVPGGRFREIYYWDSYFTMLGLAASGRRDLIENMVADFAHLIDAYGHVPNGARTYYLSRSQPPFFFAMLGLSNAEDPAAAYAKYLPQLRREHAFWMDGERSVRPGHAHRRVVAMPDGSVLNRYWDDSDAPRDESYREDTELGRHTKRPAAPLYRDIRAAAESGWDFSSRWFADGRTRVRMDTTEIVPIDLNSLLYGMELAIRRGCERSGDGACATEFKLRAARRRDRSLPVASIRRLSRLPLDSASPGTTLVGSNPLPYVRRPGIGTSGSSCSCHRAAPLARTRRRGHDAARNRRAMGLTEWVGAIAVDCHIRSARLRALGSCAQHRLSLVVERGGRVSTHRQAGRKIRRGAPRPQRRRRRISDSRWFRLDQRRDATTHDALSRRTVQRGLTSSHATHPVRSSP